MGMRKTIGEKLYIYDMKLLDDKLFEAIEVVAKASPRLRMNYDLRSQAMDEDPDWRDCSQRMLTYDSAGNELARVTLKAGSACAAVQVPRNVYHTFIPHEDGTTIFEAKDRPYDPVKTEEFLE